MWESQNQRQDRRNSGREPQAAQEARESRNADSQRRRAMPTNRRGNPKPTITSRRPCHATKRFRQGTFFSCWRRLPRWFNGVAGGAPSILFVDCEGRSERETGGVPRWADGSSSRKKKRLTPQYEAARRHQSKIESLTWFGFFQRTVRAHCERARGGAAGRACDAVRGDECESGLASDGGRRTPFGRCACANSLSGIFATWALPRWSFPGGSSFWWGERAGENEFAGGGGVLDGAAVVSRGGQQAPRRARSAHGGDRVRARSRAAGRNEGDDQAAARRQGVVVRQCAGDAARGLPREISDGGVFVAGLQLVRGSPAGRRRWLDMTLAAMDAGYLRALQTFTRALAERNALLKKGSAGETQLSAFEQTWHRRRRS
jgi:hypothetical protein